MEVRLSFPLRGQPDMSCESAYRTRGAYTPVAFNRTQVLLSSLSVWAWAVCMVWFSIEVPRPHLGSLETRRSARALAVAVRVVCVYAPPTSV